MVDRGGPQALNLECPDTSPQWNDTIDPLQTVQQWADIGEHGPEPFEEMRKLLEVEMHVVRPDDLPFTDESLDSVVVLKKAVVFSGEWLYSQALCIY